jgi:hypothetical protein
MGENTRVGQSGGVNISGVVGSVGGDIIGGNKIDSALDEALLPVLNAIKAAGPEVRPEAEVKLAALKKEAARGKDANQGVMQKLVDELVGLVPAAASAVGTAFATPLLGALVGPATKLVLDKLGGKKA